MSVPVQAVLALCGLALSSQKGLQWIRSLAGNGRMLDLNAGVLVLAVRVLFFASLSERLGIREREVAHADGLTPQALWQSLVPQEPLGGNTLVAINQEYSDADARVNDGDEVAFFPPVTGG